jgi:hypothetical protein
MKVYLISDGEYSDYKVRCICSTLEKAEYAKKFYAAYIGEYELDELPEHPQGMFLHEVVMDEGGNALSSNRISGDNCLVVDQYGVVKCEWEPWPRCKLQSSHRGVLFYMWAVDEKHAIKIANERRVMLIASCQWTTEWEVWCASREG